MPEGHFLHRLARDQQELIGATLAATSPQGKFADGAAALDGRAPVLIEAYGKHLHHRYDDEVGLHVHLGMQGKWFRMAPPTAARPQVRLRLATSAVAWDLIAPSTCALVDDVAWKGVVAGLGPDPLRADADPDRAFDALVGSPKPLGAALLDQSILAGVGNVLRAEGLFLAGIHPSRPAASIDRPTFDHLWKTLAALMAQSVADRQIQAGGRMVYKEPTCRVCGREVDVFELGGRTAYACPNCQTA